MPRYLFILLTLLAFCTPVLSQAKESAKSKADDQPKATEVVTYNTRVAKVLEIDYAKNTLDLEGEGGMKLDLEVDPTQVRNFNMIKVGDLVKVQTMESLAVTLEKAKPGEKPSAEEVTVRETAPVGTMPRAKQVETKQVTAEIIKVDAAKSMVELKGPMGRVLELTVKDPKKMEGLQKGDLVSATYTVARAIVVESVPKSK